MEQYNHKTFDGDVILLHTNPDRWVVLVVTEYRVVTILVPIATDNQTDVLYQAQIEQRRGYATMTTRAQSFDVQTQTLLQMVLRTCL